MFSKLFSKMRSASHIIFTFLLIVLMMGAAKPASAQDKVMGKFSRVQNTAWHPVPQHLTQLSFLAGCEELKLDCALATTDDTSLEALVAVAEQTVAREDAKGLAMWAGGLPVFKPIIEKAKEKGIWVALPHFPVPEGTFADNAVQIAADTTKYPDPVAKAMCDALQGQKGSVAITENNHNATEDTVAQVFAESMKKYCPDLTILEPELEGPEPTKAIAAAVAIMQANPDIVAAFSTTGGGPTTWAGAQGNWQADHRCRDGLHPRRSGSRRGEERSFGIVAQPLYDECKGAAKLLYQMANGEKVDYWTVLKAPLVTKRTIWTTTTRSSITSSHKCVNTNRSAVINI